MKQISQSIRENNKNSIPSGCQIVFKGTIYPSIAEASRQTSHSRDTLRRWFHDENNKNCVFLQNDSSKSFSKQTSVKNSNVLFLMSENTGLPKPVSIYGVIFRSITEASRERECSRANIQRLLRTYPKDCFFVPSFQVSNNFEG